MDTETHRIAVPKETEDPRPGVGTRLAALSALLLVGGSLTWLAVALVALFCDSWIAPISLSPDSDQVLQLDLQLTQERAEMDRVRAELARVEAEIAAIDGGLARLETLRNRSGDVFELGAETSGDEAATLARSIRRLRDEHEILDRLVARQTDEVTLARAHLASGLIQRRDLERQEQALDNLLLQRAGNERASEELAGRRRVADVREGEFRTTVEGAGAARLPEIVARQETDVRLELEILRLQAERRGLAAVREAAVRNLAELDEVMHQIEARPVYLATQRQLDVAFVPYDQLEGAPVGSTVVQCDAAIFFCREVGTIAEIIPGEVVTQDPWGELARGRYAVLHLDDREAVQERILRVREGS